MNSDTKAGALAPGNFWKIEFLCDLLSAWILSPLALLNLNSPKNHVQANSILNLPTNCSLRKQTGPNTTSWKLKSLKIIDDGKNQSSNKTKACRRIVPICLAFINSLTKKQQHLHMFYCLGPALSFAKTSGQFEVFCLVSINWFPFVVKVVSPYHAWAGLAACR